MDDSCEQASSLHLALSNSTDDILGKYGENMACPLYLECACCYCRLMRVEYDPEFGETFISMWSRPTSFPWLTRLRHIWKILTGGEPFEDEIILNRECMAKLSRYLAKSVELEEIIEEYHKLKHGKAGDVSTTSS